MEVEKYILETVSYYARFSYAPTARQIHRYLGVKCGEGKLAEMLGRLNAVGRLAKGESGGSARYSMPSDRRLILETFQKAEISVQKIQKIAAYARWLRLFPQVRLVGVSGSLSMENAGENDDIDIFVITAPGRLWTGRFVALVLAQLLRRRRRRGEKNVRDKICLNLFFDGRNLTVPPEKRSAFVAREIFQMKPLFSKDNIYESWLSANQWAYAFFPNIGKLKIMEQDSGHWEKPWSFFTDLVEGWLGYIQIQSIKRHLTNETVTGTQLWFFPDDYARKLD